MSVLVLNEPTCLRCGGLSRRGCSCRHAEKAAGDVDVKELAALVSASLAGGGSVSADEADSDAPLLPVCNYGKKQTASPFADDDAPLKRLRAGPFADDDAPLMPVCNYGKRSIRD